MIDFMRYRFVTIALSLTLIVGSIGFFAYKYHTTGETFNYGVDFTGGTQVLFKLSNPVTAEEVKNVLSDAGWPGAVTREFSAANEVLVRVKKYTNDAKGLAERIRVSLESSFADTQVEILQNEAVGPGVGETLRWKSILAVFFALLAMLGYILVRFFSIGFAVGSVLALLHDAILMLGFFLLFGREISINVIAAILAVIGYSINDTIVIFSQIRGNLKKMVGTPVDEIINVSLNQMLRRTLLTSVSTALTVGSILILGGEVLRDFALAFLIGIVVGTYSSIFVASPVLRLFHRENK